MSAAELRGSETALCPQVPELQKTTVRIQQPERVMGLIRAIKEQGSSKLQVRPARLCVRCALLRCAVLCSAAGAGGRPRARRFSWPGLLLPSSASCKH